jgi:hypothetical protein
MPDIVGIATKARAIRKQSWSGVCAESTAPIPEAQNKQLEAET